jgi:Holliday junction resolvase RusA-like endonuclease
VSKIAFFVSGNPVPKQSFRKTKTGGYIDPRVTAWEEAIGYKAKEIYKTPIRGNVSVTMHFLLATKRVVDLDNLSKAVLDGLKKIAFEDDSQVVDLHLYKTLDKDDPGVTIIITSADITSGEAIRVIEGVRK